MGMLSWRAAAVCCSWLGVALEHVGCLGVMPGLRVATATSISGLPADSWLSQHSHKDAP